MTLVISYRRLNLVIILEEREDYQLEQNNKKTTDFITKRKCI